MANANDINVRRMHPRRFDWIVVGPIAITLVISLLSLDGLYQKWLEPVGLHAWMENVFPRGFSGFDLYADNPLRYKVIFSWIIVVSSAAGLLVSLASAPFMYRYIVQHPRHYVGMTIVYFLILAFLLLLYHGPSNTEFAPSRSTRTILYSGIYSFGFWSVALGGTSFYFWNAFFAALTLIARRIFGLRNLPNG